MFGVEERVGDVRLATIGRNVAHDGLELRKDLGLAEGELDVLVLIVKRGDHVLDLRVRWSREGAGMEKRRIAGMGEGEGACFSLARCARGRHAERVRMYLVAPEQLVATPVLETIPDVQKLCDAVRPDVISVLFGFVPGKGRPEVEQTHGGWSKRELQQTGKAR